MVRKVLLAIVGVVIVCAGALWAAATYFLDNATIAEQLKKEVSERFNRTLVFQGELETNFFPKIELVLPATTLSFEGSEKPQFTLKGARIGVAVMPLITGDIRFDDVVIDGLQGQVNLSRAAQKAHASSSVKASEEKQEQTAPVEQESASPAFIRDLNIASLEIKNSGLTVYGLQDQKIYAVDSLNLRTGQLGLSGSTPVKFSTNFSEKTQGLKGQIALNSTVEYDLKAITMGLQNPTVTLSATQDEQNISAELKAKALKYVNRDLQLQDFSGTAKVSDMSLKASLKSAQTKAMQTWEVEGLGFNATDSKGLSIDLSGSFVGELEQFSLQSKALAGDLKAQVGRVALHVPFEGQVSLTPGERVDLSLAGKLDNAPWKSELKLTGFTVPSINGYVTLESLNLDKWLQTASAAESKKTAAASVLSPIQSAYAAQAQKLDVLNKANGRFGIHVDSMTYQALTITGLDTTMTLNNGNLALTNIHANVCEGTITGTAKVNVAEKWSLNLNAKAVNTESLLKSLGVQKAKLHGKATASINLSGIGLEQTALLKTANGQISLSANNAVLQGLSLEKVGSAVKAKRITGLIMRDEDKTVFSVLSANAVVSNGLLNVRTLEGKTNVAEVKGNAQIGLIDHTLSGLVTARLATSVDGRRVSVPIRLGGTIQTPTYGIDLEAALKAGVKDVIKEAAKDPKKLIKGLEKLFKH